MLSLFHVSVIDKDNVMIMVGDLKKKIYFDSLHALIKVYNTTILIIKNNMINICKPEILFLFLKA